MANAINFTKATLESLPLPPKGKRKYYQDTQVKGLTISVLPSNSKSFYVYKKISGKPEYIFLGSFPDLSIDNARKTARIKLGQIAEGKNPQEELRQARNEMTLGDLFNEYMSRHSRLHKKSWIYDEREIPAFLSHWFDRKISSIKRAEIKKLLDDVFEKNGRYQSNRVLERIRTMYNKAIEWGWEGINPAARIKKFREKSRDRFVQPHEMPHLIRALNEELNETARDYLWTLFLTGARKTNTLMMRWEEINWQRNEWRIPETKNGEPLIVALTDRAVDVLKQRKEKSNSHWVFPQDEDSEKHFINPKRIWKRVLQNATLYMWKQDDKISKWLSDTETEISALPSNFCMYNRIVKRATLQKIALPPDLMDIRIHDIRRTFGSYQAIGGASLQVIGKSLGHKSVQATQVYARLNLIAVRESINKSTEMMFSF